MRIPFGKSAENPDVPRTDAGSGSLRDYTYTLVPKREKTVIRLAQSDPAQEELAGILDRGVEEPEAFIARRTQEDERTDAPMPVRLFVDGRPSGVVGWIPRGLEGAVEGALARWFEREGKVRLPSRIVKTRHGLRVELQIGLTR
ncbi:hypothetical protein [Planctomonas psychrotolerans]|uniref:hypothetical protein n=1 Tax=Planctomonas psychrotolerans TaxID=2528712 RepID=UPI00123AC029|nr:hypothetical protein [Planctomonas psychrotolerans]